MNIHMSGALARLDGDWTVAGVTQHNLDIVAGALQQITSACGRRLQIDCRRVRAIDHIGQQILKVWLQCVQLRGAKPVLLVPATFLRRFFRGLGIRCRYTSQNQDRHPSASSHLKRRRTAHDSRRNQRNGQAA